MKMKSWLIFLACYIFISLEGAYTIHKKFPKLAKLDQDTPYNDRKKLGHFCWLITESDQLIIILYIIYKVRNKSF